MALALKKKERQSAVDFVIAEIKELLMQRTLKPGDKLPNEEELASTLGVSRGSVRSAMKVFNVCGIVDIRVGDGTYVCSAINPNSLNPIIIPMLILQPDNESLSTFREKIECDIIKVIIDDEKKVEAVLPKLRENLDDLQALQARKASVEVFVENDLDFHRIISHYCGNVVFETIYNFILEYFVPSMRISHSRQISGERSAPLHIQIYEAIRDRDYSLAAQTVNTYINYWIDSANHS